MEITPHDSDDRIVTIDTSVQRSLFHCEPSGKKLNDAGIDTTSTVIADSISCESTSRDPDASRHLQNCTTEFQSRKTLPEPKQTLFGPDGYGLWATNARIKSNRTITGRDYNILGWWGYIILFTLNVTIYSSLYTIAARNTVLRSPVTEKTTGMICIGLGLLLVLIQYALSLGYCIVNHKQILIRTRGIEYMLILLVAAMWCVVSQALLTCMELRIIKTSSWVYITLQATKQIAWMIYLGAQVARQRLLYELFVVHLYKIQNVELNIFHRTFGVLVAWALIGSGITAAIAAIKPTEHWYPIMFLSIIISVQVILWALYYYSWQSRHISKSFSDYRDNLLASSGSVIFPCTLIALNLLFFSGTAPPSRTNPPKVEYLFLQMTFVYFAMALGIGQLFSLLAYIQFRGLKVARDIDPKNLFAITWKQVTERSITLSSLPSARADNTKAFTLVAIGMLNPYGPPAVDQNQ